MSRQIQDGVLTVTKALPAAAASNNTDSLDLGTPNIGDFEGLEVELSAPAVGSGVNTTQQQKVLGSDPVVLHGALFDADMKTNIDDVALDGSSVSDVSQNLAALRKLMGKDSSE